MRADRATRRRRRLALGRSLGAWIALGVVWALDAHGPHVGERAAVFGVIFSAISWLAGIVGDAGAAIATSAEAAIVFLSHSLGWLTGRVADILSNTGSMFSKVWEGAKIIYGDVVKPAIEWLHDTYESIKGWMTRVFGPVFEWANRVRAELQSLYKRFVRPILNILDTSKAVLDMLAKLHVPFAATLEHVVTDIESTIVEHYLQLLGYVNKVIDTLNGLFTLDGLLQRFVFLRTLERDAYFVWRVMMNTSSRELTEDERAKLHRAVTTQSVDELNGSLEAYWGGEQNDVGDVIDAIGDRFAARWQDGGADAAA